jgi:isopentenyl diphosphate isomerase/L-lactate dehydrogenase-like FMN-dependent dehydrogenase
VHDRPDGIADLLAYRGELALANAATKAGIPFSLSSSSTTPMEQVFEATQGSMWLQLYLWENRADRCTGVVTAAVGDELTVIFDGGDRYPAQGSSSWDSQVSDRSPNWTRH